MKTLLRMLVLLAVLSPAAALAQDTSAQAREHYKKGRVHYDLGRFDQAIVEFEKAFELTGAPELLFNLAQSHRMAGNKERALFFYRRYLSLSPNAPNKAEVQGRIAELEKGMSDEEQKRKDEEARKLEEQRKADEARRLEEEKKSQPVEEPPVQPTEPATVDTGGGAGTAATVSAQPAGPHVPRIFLGVDVGTAKVGFGSDYESEVPAQATLQIRGAYRWRFGTLFADAGALASFTTLPYYLPDATTKKSSSLIGLVAGGAFGYAQPRWNVRLELGAGMLAWGGLEQGNPFTAQFPENDAQGRMGGLGAEGTLGMFNFRLAVVPEVVVWHKLSAAMTLAFQGASAPDGMHDTVDGVQRVELLFGLGYSL